jgi:gliding motility-associated-like protein
VILQACEGSTVDYNGTLLNPGDQEDFSFTNVSGCDSTVTVFVETLSTSDTTLNLAACEGETLIYDGVPIPAGTEAAFSYLSVNGCDSLVTVIVEALTTFDTTIQFSACEGSSIVFDGISILAGEQQVFTYQDTAGCDSVITVIVETLAVYENDIALQACEGDSVSYNGQLIAAGASIQLMYTTVAGCDSIININVEALMSSTESLEFVVCPGEAITYNGELLEAGSQAAFLLTNSVGCDSVINVSVAASDPILVEVSTENTCPNVNSGIAGIELLPGSSSPLTFDLDGQGFSTDLTYTGLAAGEHQFFILDENDCEAIVDFTIESEPPLIINIASRAITCEESTGQLDAAVISGDDGNVQLLWNEGTIGALLESQEAGTYQLMASNNCEEIALEAVIQDLRPNELSLIYVPNAFSPNDDGVNDMFRTYTSMDAFWRDYRFMIFDRWGDMLFETTNPEEGWDGTYRGVEMNNAVHVWYVEGSLESCGRVFEVQREGGVVIVR